MVYWDLSSRGVVGIWGLEGGKGGSSWEEMGGGSKWALRGEWCIIDRRLGCLEVVSFMDLVGGSLIEGNGRRSFVYRSIIQR